MPNNVFDQFDSAPASGGNVFDQFDGRKTPKQMKIGAAGFPQAFEEVVRDALSHMVYDEKRYDENYRASVAARILAAALELAESCVPEEASIKDGLVYSN